MDPLPAALCFPRPPWRIDHSLMDSPPANAAVAAYIEQIRSWRMAVLEFIARSDGKPESEAGGLSERARKALTSFLETNWPARMQEWADGSVFNVSAFPSGAASASSHPTMDLVLQVLRWRAGFGDYLSDVCTAMSPALELDECMAMGRFLDPSGQRGLCHNCLTDFPPEEIHPSSHQCLLLAHVRAKWPAIPDTLARWAEEAKPARLTTGSDPSVQRDGETSTEAPGKRWWQIWKSSSRRSRTD